MLSRRILTTPLTKTFSVRHTIRVQKRHKTKRNKKGKKERERENLRNVRDCKSGPNNRVRVQKGRAYNQDDPQRSRRRLQHPRLVRPLPPPIAARLYDMSHCVDVCVCVQHLISLLRRLSHNRIEKRQAFETSR